jgi:hypothetical protein
MSNAPPPHTAKKQRGRARSLAPFVSLRPWAGFTAQDSPRPQPLERCPSARCRRAKACIAALDGLYCLRTHHSLAELQARARHSDLQRELDSVPPVPDETDFPARMERIAELAQIRRAHEARMLAAWKAGTLSPGLPKFRSAGVVMRPPPKAYVEGPSQKSKNRGGQGGKGDV